jgi:hypothetical protein
VTTGEAPASFDRNLPGRAASAACGPPGNGATVVHMRLILGIVLFVSLGCTKPDPGPIEHPLDSTLGAAVPAAYAATLAMTTLGGGTSPCTNVVTPAGSADVMVNVSLGAGCPPMFTDGESGTVVVAGAWTPQEATFSMDFTNATSGDSPILVVGIGVMSVTPMGSDHLIIVYGEEAISVGTGSDAGGGIDEVVWTVDVDTAGTPDPTDDTISVSGGAQNELVITGQAPKLDLTQVAVGDAVFNPGCRKNPNSGVAAVQRAGTEADGWVLFAFHSACDGTADVAAALAPYTPLITSSLPLVFLEQ